MKVNKAYLPQLQTQTGNHQDVGGHNKAQATNGRPASDKKLFEQILKECLTK